MEDLMVKWVTKGQSYISNISTPLMKTSMISAFAAKTSTFRSRNLR